MQNSIMTNKVMVRMAEIARGEADQPVEEPVAPATPADAPTESEQAS
jgi:hypothetical protein